MSEPLSRPGWDEYYMGMAIAARERADCTGNRVGAVTTRENRQLTSGYNGTPSGMRNCSDNGCIRCANPHEFRSGEGYDLCICRHAEQNAFDIASKFGIALEGATLYTTMRPCFGCSTQAIGVGIVRVVYLHEWSHPEARFQREYERLQEAFPEGVHHLPLHDPRADWAVRTRRRS